MRRIINSTYLSLDGDVQHLERWSFDYRSDDVTRFTREQLFGSDALVMGRHTYEGFARHWPTATDDAAAEGLADRMNSLPKYVVSDTITETPWNPTIVIRRHEAAERLRQLKSEPGQDIIQYGFGPVTTTMLDEDLLDELRIWVHPVLAGGNDPTALLAHVGVEARLALLDVTRFESGIVILSYRPTK